MELVNLRIKPTDLAAKLGILPLPPDIDLENATAQSTDVAKQWANIWLHQGKPYYNLQQHEYEELFRFLFPRAADNTTVATATTAVHKSNKPLIFIATTPGQAIDEYISARGEGSSSNWMACDLDASATVCPFLPHLQAAKNPKSGQLCVFRPQVQLPDAFTEKHLFSILNTIGQHVQGIVIDGTVDTHYEFHLQIALQRVVAAARGDQEEEEEEVEVETGGGGGGRQRAPFFVWRVRSDFFCHHLAFVQQLLMHFGQVQVATLNRHDMFDTHFIIATNPFTNKEKQMANAASESDHVREREREGEGERLLAVANALIDRWVAKARHEYYRYLALAAFMQANGVTTADAAEKFWAQHSEVFLATAALMPNDCTVIE